MKKSEFVSGRVREVLLDGRWIANTNYSELIRSVTWKQATQKVGNLNTIALLTFHINYYLQGLNNVFKGGQLEISDRFSFDMAPIEKEADWNGLVESFLSNAKEFSGHVKDLPEDKFDAPFVDEKYGTYLRNIEAVIEHSYYHMGQISLIRKMVLELNK